MAAHGPVTCDSYLTTEKQYLLLTFVALAVVVFAPAKVTLTALLIVGVVTMVVKLTASKFIGPVSLADAFKAVGWSVAMLGVALFGLLLVSGGRLELEGSSQWPFSRRCSWRSCRDSSWH